MTQVLKSSTRYFCAAVVILTIFSCKKEAPKPAAGSTTNTTEKVSPSNPGGILPTPAHGAFYSTMYFDTEGATPTLEPGYTAFAWFGDYPVSKDAGLVTYNGIQFNRTTEDSVSLYFYFDDTSIQGNKVSWSTTGNAKYPAISDTDSSNFPLIEKNDVPDTLEKGSHLKITYNAIAGGDQSFVTAVARTENADAFSGLGNPGKSEAVAILNKDLQKLYDDPAFDGTITLELVGQLYVQKYFGDRSYYFIKRTRYFYTVVIKD